MQQVNEQMSLFDQDMPCGRMSPELSAQTKGKTSESCSKSSVKSKTKMPIFLNLLGGGWSTSGTIMGNGYSVAWRVLDARFWGVPQRRRRIWLVADFAGGSAPQILFIREGLSRSFAESRAAWEGTTDNSKNCT